MSVPAWERDDRPGVKVFSKICPDCALMDAEGSDPRRGMRHASEFGLHYRSQDGLQPYCRHHMRQRRRHEAPSPAPGTAGPLSAAAMHALRPAEGAPDNGQEEPVPTALASSTADVLMDGLASLEARLRGLEERLPPEPPAGPEGTALEALAVRVGHLEERPALGPEDVRALGTALSDRLDVEQRLVALEAAPPKGSPASALTSRLQGVVEALAQRVAALERSEKEEDDTALLPGGHESANTRSLRRWTKQLGKEVANLATRVERTEAKTAEAVRLAQAAGRINAGRPPEPAPPEAPAVPDPAALRQQLAAALEEHLAQQPALTVDETALRARIADAIKVDVWQDAEQKVAATVQGQVSLYLAQILDAVDGRVDARLAAWSTKEDGMTDTPPPTALVPRTAAVAPPPIQDTLVALLTRYAAGLHNLGQIEREGLLDADLLAVASDRLTQRTADDLRSLIDDLLTTGERTP